VNWVGCWTCHIKKKGERASQSLREGHLKKNQQAEKNPKLQAMWLGGATLSESEIGDRRNVRECKGKSLKAAKPKGTLKAVA